MLGLGGEREVIGLQVAPAGTEDPEEKPEVCHLTGGGPSILITIRRHLCVLKNQEY